VSYGPADSRWPFEYSALADALQAMMISTLRDDDKLNNLNPFARQHGIPFATAGKSRQLFRVLRRGGGEANDVESSLSTSAADAERLCVNRPFSNDCLILFRRFDIGGLFDSLIS
jgi:hypothetical protein